jgi:hypothetical protein
LTISVGVDLLLTQHSLFVTFVSEEEKRIYRLTISICTPLMAAMLECVERKVGLTEA